MSQLRHAPRALDTQGHQGKGKKVGYIFSHPPIRKDPRFQSTIADLCLQRRRAMHECRTHSTTLLPAIIPAHDHESWRSRSTMEFGTTMPGSRISLEEHHAGLPQEDFQHLDTPMEALFTAAACTCNSPIGFQTAILSSETIAVGNPTTKLLPPPPSYKQVPRCRTISCLFSTRYWTSMPQLRHLLHPCWCRREVHFPVQSVLTTLCTS
jgi:hypothetical protein